MDFEIRKPAWADPASGILDLCFVNPGGTMTLALKPEDFRALYVVLSEHLAVQDLDTPESPENPTPITPNRFICVGPEVRNPNGCDAGPINWQAAYFTRKQFGGRVSMGVRGPMCQACAMYEQQWSNSIGAIMYAIAEKIPDGEKTT